MGVTHKTYPVTGTVATGIAARIPGTIVHQAASSNSHERVDVRIGHPAGIIHTKVDVGKRGNKYEIKTVTVGRTARRIMEGCVFLRRSILCKY